jgi:crotonobetainyl-CoA:carnitine CoA-transferase CaiB-like acyl-CoA transferase
MDTDSTKLPLDGLLVLDFSQFLSGPFASLRLADLGARVIKIERPLVGDLCRQLYLTDTVIGDDSTLFHAINRRKESFAADLKDPRDIDRLRKLVARADVMVQNFRPGVMERLGFHYDAVRQLNPRLIFAQVSGYGAEGPWAPRPGQDLLAQARSGIMWLNGDRDDPPTPVGLALADMLAGHNLVEGILAKLVRRGVTGKGGLVETSLLEGLIDFQFEVLTTYFNDGGRKPARAEKNNAHAYLAAPYGTYETANGYLAIAMTPIPILARLLKLPALELYAEPQSWFAKRDEIKTLIADRLKTGTTEFWLSILEPADVWCAPVLDWQTLRDHEGYRALDMEQTIRRDDGVDIRTTRSPIRIDGMHLRHGRAAPAIGAHTQSVIEEFGLDRD